MALLSFAAPFWLAGLVLLPAIRWLHRSGPHRREVHVSRLALWDDAAASRPSAGERRPPDPAWRRRALLAALLLIALSGPQRADERARVTLWIDDSLSMLTREGAATRLDAGLARVRALLAEGPRADVEVRTLADPWRVLGALDDAAVATVRAGAGRVEPTAPPEALLKRDREHWLLTDGADATVLAWPGARQPDRVVQVAGLARNVGLVRLSARRHGDDPATIDVLLQVANGGSVDEERSVVFSADGVDVARADVAHLGAGASQRIEVSLPAAATVRAALRPNDALPEDDELALDLAPLRRRRVAVDSVCPQALAAAVTAHPGLTSARDAVDAEARVACSASGEADGMPTIRVRAEQRAERPSGALRWSSAVAPARRTDFATDRLQVAAHLQAGPGDDVLLAIGDTPVVVRRGGERGRLETSFDFAAMAATRGPESPLLLNWLLETALDARLIDEIAVIDRGPRAVLVAPRASLAASPVAAPADRRAMSDLTAPLVLVALAVLLWELVALARQGLHLRAPPTARRS